MRVKNHGLLAADRHTRREDVADEHEPERGRAGVRLLVAALQLQFGSAESARFVGK